MFLIKGRRTISDDEEADQNLTERMAEDSES